MPFPATGATIALRRLEPADLRTFQTYRSDVEVGRYQGWSPMTDAAAIAFIASMHAAAPFCNGEWLQVGIADAGTGRLLGDMGLHLSDDGAEGEIGFTLARSEQGRGAGVDAVTVALRLFFACTGVERVIGVTDARNEPSIRLLERVGMQRIKSAAAVFRGEPCVEYTYAIERAQHPIA